MTEGLHKELSDSQADILQAIENNANVQTALMQCIKSNQTIFKTEIDAVASEWKVTSAKLLLYTETGFENLTDLVERLKQTPQLDAKMYAYNPDPDSRERNRFLFDTDRVSFLGRTNEITKLKQFRDADQPLLWWAVLGQGGLGKSRLALQFCEQALKEGWDAGFLKAGQETTFDQWDINKPTFIVIDEASRRIEEVAKLINLLNKEQEHPIRVLLLDRPQDKMVGISLEDQLEKNFPQINEYRHSPDDPLLNISSMKKDDLRQVMETIFEEEKYKKAPTEEEWETLLKTYQKIDPYGRPLLAMFAAETIAKSQTGIEQIQSWSAQDLAKQILTRELDSYWIQNTIPEDQRVNDAHLNVIVAATIQDGLDTASLNLLRKAGRQKTSEGDARFEIPSGRALSSHILHRIVGFTGGEEIDIKNSIPPFLPPFLGELLVLDRLDGRLQVQGAGTPKSKEETFEILCHCWRTAPLQTSLFLKSAFQSFPKHPAIAAAKKLQDSNLPPYSDTAAVPAAAYFYRALTFNYADHPAGAIEDYDKAIKIDPQDAAAYYNRGYSKFALKKYEEAIEDYGKAIEIDPQLAQAYFNRGVSKSALGDQAGGIEDYGKAMEIDPQDAQAYSNRGNSKSALGDEAGAIEDYDKAIEIDPQYAAAYYNRGVSKSALGDEAGAIEDYGKAIEIDPQYVAAHYNRGLSKSALGDKAGAIEDYDKAIKIDPQLAAAYANKSDALTKIGKFQEAVTVCKEAIDLGLNNAVLHINLGEAEKEMKNYAAAKIAIEDALQLGTFNDEQTKFAQTLLDEIAQAE